MRSQPNAAVLMPKAQAWASRRGSLPRGRPPLGPPCPAAAGAWSAVGTHTHGQLLLTPPASRMPPPPPPQLQPHEAPPTFLKAAQAFWPGTHGCLCLEPSLPRVTLYSSGLSFGLLPPQRSLPGGDSHGPGQGPQLSAPGGPCFPSTRVAPSSVPRECYGVLRKYSGCIQSWPLPKAVLRPQLDRGHVYEGTLRSCSNLWFSTPDEDPNGDVQLRSDPSQEALRPLSTSGPSAPPLLALPLPLCLIWNNSQDSGSL